MAYDILNARRLLALVLIAALLGVSRIACADGVSAYLPLNLEPEIERQIERVLILADEPILKRPFAVALIELALPQACLRDKVLCGKVRRYLERYSRDYAVTHASLTGSYTHGEGTVPNEHGLNVSSHDELSIIGYVQPNDYVLMSLGGISYSDRTTATGTMLSIGSRYAQIDIGYRDHWLSPMSDSSALISTEAPTTPSVTLSNYEPLTRLGFQYEMYLTKLSTQPLVYNGVQDPSGAPKLFGIQLSIEPFSGWSLGFNRQLEYGGGDNLPGSARFLLRDFVKPVGSSQNQGNQQASYVSRYIAPTKVPFAMYFQYAGEDSSFGGSYLLGEPMTLAGIDFPRIARHFDATYEIGEWSDIWYVHYIYQNGMTNDRLVLGNWGADQRNFNDGVGARSQMFRIGWLPPFGGYLEERVREVQNQTYYGGDSRVYTGHPAFPYHHYYDATVRYSRPWNGVTVGGEAFGGRDVDGKSFARLSAFVRYGGDSRTRDDGAYDEDEQLTPDSPRGTEIFVEAGGNANKVSIDIAKELPVTTTNVGFGPHFGAGARRAISEHNDLGARVEFDQVDGHSLIQLRALDYRYRFDNPLALSLFGGVARYNLVTPATSLYAGLGATWRNVLRGWDLDVDFKHGQALARDHELAIDFQGARPESFYKINMLAVYISRHF